MNKKNAFFLFCAASALFSSSCEEEAPDTPQVSSYQLAESAYMADSIPFSVTVSAEYPLNKVRTQLFFEDTKVAEVLLPVNKAGTYSGRLYVPFAKNVANGTAEVRILVTNKNFDISVTSLPIGVLRPEYPYLTLKTAFGDYQMSPVAGEPYQYAATQPFPVQLLMATIETPAYGENGSKVLFGGAPIKESSLPTDSIAFLTDAPIGTPYTVSFNTLTYAAEPFVVPSFGGYEFGDFVNNLATIEDGFTQNQKISIRGFLDLADWWIDPTFLDSNDDGTYEFRAMSGKYRVTADRNLKFFRVEPMSGDALADFDLPTHTGGIWINGNANIGVPSYTANGCSWTGDKNFAMAPMGDGIYELKLITGKTLHPQQSGNNVNFKFFVASKNTGTGFVNEASTSGNPHMVKIVKNLYGGSSSDDPSGGTERFTVGSGSNDGNIQSVNNRALVSNRTYLFRVDAKSSPAELSIYLEEE
ncbi:MAG: DUF5125 domain-containing protein [Prevotellaceae bacterium]|jgi:hypothetical protein|nr:DUF5125 domain-containing protein [Prevotellaceae bacterium]